MSVDGSTRSRETFEADVFDDVAFIVDAIAEGIGYAKLAKPCGELVSIGALVRSHLWRNAFGSHV